jgi:aminoglycoside phosphotransferase
MTDEVTRRRHALVACGLPADTPMTRVPSYANETWIGDDVVLRINTRGVGRLAREAALVRRLPRAALHPGILAIGDDGTLEWSLSPRVRGIDLGRAWRTMTDANRERATHELAHALAAVHATPTAGIPDDIEPPHTLPLGPLLDLVDTVAALHGRRPILDHIADFIRARWDAFDDRDTGLVHGDPHLENVLWDGAHVSALLDFEWSRASWIHADLEILLSVSDDPKLFASADHEDSVDPAQYAHLPRWLAAAQPAWFSHPRLGDRLDVLRASRTLGQLTDGDWALRWQHLQEILDGNPAFRQTIKSME